MAEANERRLLGRRRRENARQGDGADGARDKRYVVTVNPEEDTELQARALVAGVTVPRLLFESAMSSQIETSTDRAAAVSEIFQVRRLMANMSNNINQLAHFANAEGAFPADAELAVAEYRAMLPLLRAAAERVVRG